MFYQREMLYKYVLILYKHFDTTAKYLYEAESTMMDKFRILRPTLCLRLLSLSLKGKCDLSSLKLGANRANILANMSKRVPYTRNIYYL